MRFGGLEKLLRRAASLEANCGLAIADCGLNGTAGSIRNPKSAIRNYSYRSASTGSSLAALFAGYIPNPTPVRADAARAATMDQRGTCAGIGVKLETAKATMPPTSI